VVGFAAYAPIARFVLHGPVDAQSLSTSLLRELGLERGGGAGCRPARPREWRCRVMAALDSGDVPYRLRVRPNSSCWEATIGDGYGEDGRYPEHVSGCVHRWQWSLFE
jgi:hypothetical protein